MIVCLPPCRSQFQCNGTSGLAPGQGVCWNPVEYNRCPTPSPPPPSPPPAMGSFTDDEGTTHTWAVAAPKIVTGAFQALTLMDMGLPASQIHGTVACYKVPRCIAAARRSSLLGRGAFCRRLSAAVAPRPTRTIH